MAKGFPTPLKEETVAGETFWTTEVDFLEGVKWSDGTEVTAEDYVFTAQTVVDLELAGNWATTVDPEVFDHAEALGPYKLKVFFKQKRLSGGGISTNGSSSEVASGFQRTALPPWSEFSIPWTSKTLPVRSTTAWMPTMGVVNGSSQWPTTLGSPA